MIPDHVVLALHRERIAAAQRRGANTGARAPRRSARPPDPGRLRIAAGEQLMRWGERLARPQRALRP